jgi:hypothetical protein
MGPYNRKITKYMEPSELARVHSLNWRMNLQTFEGFILVTKAVFERF